MDQSANPKPPPLPPPPRRRRKKAICITAVVALLLTVIVIMIVLGFTVFKAKKPVISVVSVSIDNFDFSIGIDLRVSVNASLAVDLSVKNPNRVGFRFSNSTALLYYDGGLVGEAPLPAGRIGAGKTIGMNLTLDLMADRLLSNPNLYSDVISGSLNLSTYARISGRVPILFVKIKVVSTSTCNITIDVTNRTIKDNVCKYKNSL